MRTRSLRRGRLLALAAALLGLAGCVERRMVIMTDPPHAIVFDEKNQPLGASPVDRTFVYYGKYRFRLVKDGYETLIVEERVRPPWYEFFPLDFISENLIPWTLRDVRYFKYPLKPLPVVTPRQVKDEADALRARGQTIGTPLPTPAPAPAPVEAPAPRPVTPEVPPIAVPVPEARPMPGP